MTMPHQFDPDELLEYETQQEAVPDNPTVPVRIDVPVVTVPAVPQHIVCRTITLTAAQPYVQVLNQDPLRERAQFLRCDNHFVICHSLQQAQDPVNTTAGTSGANGTYITATFSAPVPVLGPQAMWIATNVFPTVVSVIIERRTG